MNLVTILGQTSSGKSQLAVDLAKTLLKANQKVAIVNCDSRQIYKYLDIGTAKIPGNYLPLPNSNTIQTEPHEAFFWQEVPHFLIDYVDPTQRYTLIQYLQDFIELCQKLNESVDSIILVGGTGLWAKAVIEQYQPGIIKSEFENEYLSLKQQFSNWSLERIQQEYEALIKLNPSLPRLNQSDYHNSRRVLNWLLRTQSQNFGWTQDLIYPHFIHSLYLAIKVEQNELKDRVASNLDRRISAGLVEETARLVKQIGIQRLLELGLEYRLAVQYIQGSLSQAEFLDRIHKEEWQYAKRQLTWLKKQNLTWVKGLEDVSKLKLLSKLLD